jgi:hypothetical protein
VNHDVQILYAKRFWNVRSAFMNSQLEQAKSFIDDRFVLVAQTDSKKQKKMSLWSLFNGLV